MVGEHIRELKARAHTMTPGDIEQSRKAWLNASDALLGVGRRLEKAAPRLLAGFGNSDIGNTAQDTFQSAGKKILERQKDLQAAAETLEPVYVAAFDAKSTAGNDTPDPGERPTPTDTTGTGMTPAEAMTQDARQMRAYNQRVAALGAADEQARLKLQALDKSYDEAAVVLAKIHGDPDVPGPGTRNDGTGDTGGGSLPVSAGTRPGQAPLHGPTSTQPVPHLPAHGTGTPPAITSVEPGTSGYQPSASPGLSGASAYGASGLSDGAPAAPSGVHGGAGGGGMGPVMSGGSAAAGLFGAAGLAKGARGLLGGRLSAGSTGAIGSSSRTAGAGSLGRGGSSTGTPGSQTNRGAGGGRSGGRAGGRGTPGSQGKAGGRGGRGSGAGAGGQRGRKKSDEQEARERELFDDGQDWIDDEGTGPAVLS